MKNKVNLLILGASGGVANAFLYHLGHHRNLFNKVVLLDKRKRVLSDPYLDHKSLDYTFIHKKIELPEKESEYLEILKKNSINLVLDITDEESIPILEATNKAGISYINTAMNDDKRCVLEILNEIFARRKNEFNSAAHILCTGMNPGVVNMWVRHGIEKFGIPKEVIHFEYDTSRIAKKWMPMMTWSIKEFLVEAVKDPSGVLLGRNKVKQLLPNALENRKSLEPILKPILRLHKYPYGFEVMHEENVTISHKYDIPSKFIYAINQKTMENIIEIYEKKGDVNKADLCLGDNTTKVLDGSDNIGVLLDYPDKKVYYFNSVPNIALIGTSATYTQVITGIFASIFTWLFDEPEKGIHFVEDLYDSHFKYYLFDNMRVQEFIFKKGNKLKLVNYNPEIKIKRKHHLEHIYI